MTKPKKPGANTAWTSTAKPRQGQLIYRMVVLKITRTGMDLKLDMVDLKVIFEVHSNSIKSS